MGKKAIERVRDGLWADGAQSRRFFFVKLWFRVTRDVKFDRQMWFPPVISHVDP